MQNDLGMNDGLMYLGDMEIVINAVCLDLIYYHCCYSAAK